MNAPGIGAHDGRIASIRDRLGLDEVRTGGGDFGELLRAAEAVGRETKTDPRPDPAQTVEPGPVAARYEPAPIIGMLGIPVAVHDPGALAAALADGSFGWTGELPERGRQWVGHIEAAAQRHGLDPRLLASLVWAESSFKADAVSRAGALGLAQLMPGTAAGLGVDPLNPAENLDGGARYLTKMLDDFGSLDLALAAYNAGPGRVRAAGGIPQITETQAYVARVLGYYQRLGGTP